MIILSGFSLIIDFLTPCVLFFYIYYPHLLTPTCHLVNMVNKSVLLLIQQVFVNKGLSYIKLIELHGIKVSCWG